jgi:hypothetical protein
MWSIEHGAHAPAHEHAGHEHGDDLNGLALSATLHCLTGCAIGEIVGLAIATAVGLANAPSILLAIVLAFVFGYSLTSLPLLRAGLAPRDVVPIAFASDTASIGLMEVVDNAIVLAIPGAMAATLGDALFWGSLSFALVIAGIAAFPLNRWLLERGKGHAAVHRTGIHGGPSVRVVAMVVVVMAIFGSVVLLREAIG